MDEDERIRFGIEGMDRQLVVALDKRLLVVKPGFVREPNIGRLGASINCRDVTAIETRASLTNWVLMFNS